MQLCSSCPAPAGKPQARLKSLQIHCSLLMMFSGPLTIVPVLPCLKIQPYIPFKTSHIVLVMEKKHHLCRLWMSIWIYWYVCISYLCQCALCQQLIIISCICCCLASTVSTQCTKNNTPDDESRFKILWFVHGQSMKLLSMRSIMGLTSHTACAVQQTRNTYTAMGLKTRTKILHLALKQHNVSFNFKATLFSNIQYWLF